MRYLDSTDGVRIAVHELAGDPAQPTLLVAHATGFHARCYVPYAAALTDRFRVVGHDFRGHGHSTVDPNWDVDWARFGDDAVVVARHLAPAGGLVGFGHSMGGAALLLAAHREPDLFERLVLFEPISHQAPGTVTTRAEMRERPIVQSALRRRRRFGSFDEAIDNYRSKPPLSIMVDDALRNYVEYGFAPAIDDSGNDCVELRCPPEIEAGVFMASLENGVWALLPEIEVPCLVIGGRLGEQEPSMMTESIAERLPNGTYLRLDHQTHFGPFSHPDEIAELTATSSVR